MEIIKIRLSVKYVRPACSECKQPMVRKGKRLFCKACGHYERRELIKDALVRVGHYDHEINSLFLKGRSEE